MNETIKTQLNHRTIRAFEDKPLTKEEVNLLVEVAQRTASSMYLQAYSIISVTDPALKKELAAVSGQPYVANNGHLFVFVVDQRRNTEIAKALGQDRPTSSTKPLMTSALTANKSARVIPGLRGTPARITTTSAPSTAVHHSEKHYVICARPFPI